MGSYPFSFPLTEVTPSLHPNKTIIPAENLSLPPLSAVTQSTNPEKLRSYLNDESNLIQGFADKLFLPSSTREVAAIMAAASQTKTPVTVSGAGTGVTGSRVPLGGWVLSTELLRSVEQSSDGSVAAVEWIDRETNLTYGIVSSLSDPTPTVKVPAGMTLDAIQRLVRELGWFYPPDPTEWSAFIGGAVATNASGARTFKFGSTRQYVEGLRVVLSTGAVVRLDRTQTIRQLADGWQVVDGKKALTITLPTLPQLHLTKNAVGFPTYPDMPLLELFVGTEGTLGVVTEVVLRLVPRPKTILSLVSFFDSYNKALAFVSTAQQHRAEDLFPIPMSVEFFDSNSLDLIRQRTKHVPQKAVAAVYLEQDASGEEELDKSLEIWAEKLEEVGELDSWAEMDDAGIERHKSFRHSLPEGVNEIIRRNGVSKLGTDFSVPTDRFGDVFQLYQQVGAEFEQYQRSLGGQPTQPAYVLFGHIGDSHLHMNFLPRSQEELDHAKGLYLRMVKQVVAWGGTISAEHGVGKKEYEGRPYLYYLVGEDGLSQLRTLKRQLDPAEVLNKGNLF